MKVRDRLKERDWDSLIYSLGQGTCILLLGPGIDVTLEGGGKQNLSDSLAARLADDLDEETPSSASLGHVAQRYYQSEGRAGLESAVVRFFERNRPEVQEADALAHLARLPFRLILSTRHDHALDAYLRAAGKEPDVRSFDVNGGSGGLLQLGTVQKPLVYYLFGDLSDPASLVLSEEDILRFLIAVVSRSPELPSSIRSEIQKRGSMFFLAGFGIQHWYTRVLLSVMGASEAESRSFAVNEFRAFSRSTDQEAALFFQREFRIDTVMKEGEEILAELAEKWEAEGVLAAEEEGANGSGPAPSGGGARVFISYVHEDGTAAEELYHLMKEGGLDPFWDKEGLRGGDTWDPKLKSEVSEADYVVVLQSRNLAAREFTYVLQEVDLALAKQRQANTGVRFIFPLLLDDGPGHAKLTAIQSMPATNSQEMAEVVKEIARDFQRRLRR